MKRIIELDPFEVQIPERFRKNIDSSALQVLKDSIQQLGQLQPIGVLEKNGSYVLVFGHRRLLSCRELGIKVKAIVLDAPITSLDEKILEFVENAVREDFSPAEKAVAVKLLHEKLSEQRKNWSVEKTAKLLGLTRQYVSDLIRIGKAVQEGLIKEEEQKKASMTMLRKLTSRKQQIENIRTEVQKKLILPKNYKILHMDSFQIPTQKPEFKSHFDLMITDPPYGIEVSKKSNLDRTLKTFDDSKTKISTEFCAEVLRLADFLLNENGVLLIFCSLEQFMSYRFLATEFGFKYFYPKPLIWINKTTGIPYNKFCPSSCYEILFFAKRDRDTEIFNVNPPDWFNIKAIPSGQRVHPTEKPEELFYMLLMNFARPSARFIDPFCGSGNSVLAAVSHTLPEAVGIDKDPEFVEIATKRLEKRLAETLGQKLSTE